MPNFIFIPQQIRRVKMPDEVEVSKIVKTSSDGIVKISVDTYNELL